MYRVYGDSISGNCYKVELVMNELALPFVWVEMDLLAGDTPPSGSGMDGSLNLPRANPPARSS